MSDSSLSPHIALRELTRILEPEYSLLWGWRDRVEQWRAELRPRLRDLLALPDAAPDLSVRELHTVDEEGFSRTRIGYDVECGVAAVAWVCVPHDNEAPLPAVICAHPRGPGKDETVGLVDGEGGRPGLPFAAELARRGYVTVAPDLRGFGERRGDETALATAGDLLGRPLAGMHVWDLLRAAEYARSRPDVNCGRVGILGMGLGGIAGLLAAALDESIACVAACGGLSTYRELIVSRDCFLHGGPPVLVVPGLLRYADLDDVVCLVPPRPVCLLQDPADRSVPRRGAEELLRRVEAGFALMGEDVKLQAEMPPAGGGPPTPTASDFLDSWLKLPGRTT